MKLFKNLISLAAFLVGAYQAASIVDGKATVNLDNNACKFEISISLPGKACREKSAAAQPDQLSPNYALVPPMSEGTRCESGH